MTEYLCREITADVIGAYLIVYRDTCAFRREYEPAKLAKELMWALAERDRVSIQVFPPKRGSGLGRNTNAQSAFLVNSQVLVVVTKVIHLRIQDREALEKQLGTSEWEVGLALNFGSRTPEFWRSQKNNLKQNHDTP
jgi:hypothetical protein